MNRNLFMHIEYTNMPEVDIEVCMGIPYVQFETLTAKYKLVVNYPQMILRCKGKSLTHDAKMYTSELHSDSIMEIMSEVASFELAQYHQIVNNKHVLFQDQI